MNIRHFPVCLLSYLCLLVAAGIGNAAENSETVIDIASRLELFVDDFLIDKMDGVEMRMNRPIPRGIVIVHDEPWEGNNGCYHAIFQDGDIYRMYYTSAQNPLFKDDPSVHPLYAAYAESRDGIHWEKPNLGLIEFEGSKANNLIWEGDAQGAHDLTPFKDTNPACQPAERYKAVGLVVYGGGQGQALYAFKSLDGIHFSRMGEEAIITQGAFDTQNLAFWDGVRKEYRAYIRGYHDGIRDIRTATSQDFVHWTDPVMLEYPGSPDEALYTNQVIPYYRAPHIFLGFPTRYVERDWTESHRALPEFKERQQRAQMEKRFGTAITDGLFMTSRDGVTFKRWKRAFIPPGLQEKGRWVYGDNYQNWGIVETRSDVAGAPNELSIYAIEGDWRGKSDWLRRYTIRIDGFISLQATLDGGEVLTKPLTFEGNQLVMNYGTSAAGSVYVEIQDGAGEPIEGFALSDCPEIFGDTIERVVSWKGGSDVSALAGKAVRLRFVLKEADLYSIRFRTTPDS